MNRLQTSDFRLQTEKAPGSRPQASGNQETGDERRNLLRWQLFDTPKPYAEILKLQQEIFDHKLQHKEAEDVVIFCQHTPVITLGKRTQPEHLYLTREAFQQRGVDVHDIPRGGSVTAHEPGQLVIYPIVNLHRHGLKVSQFVDALVGWMVALCCSQGLVCHDKPSQPIQHPLGTHLSGVWVEDRKVASIGIRVQRGVSMHGIALNVNNTCQLFDSIAPCGISQLKVTSLARELGHSVDMKTLIHKAKDLFPKYLF